MHHRNTQVHKMCQRNTDEASHGTPSKWHYKTLQHIFFHNGLPHGSCRPISRDRSAKACRWDQVMPRSPLEGQRERNGQTHTQTAWLVKRGRAMARGCPGNLCCSSQPGPGPGPGPGARSHRLLPSAPQEQLPSAGSYRAAGMHCSRATGSRDAAGDTGWQVGEAAFRGGKRAWTGLPGHMGAHGWGLPRGSWRWRHPSS